MTAPHQPDALRRIMRHHDGPVDACIVGSGAAGAVPAKELAEAGMTVVVLEAGRWLDTQKDFVNDELSMLGVLDWDDTRITDGNDPLKLGRVNTGRAVGGTTVHYTAAALRLDPTDFATASRDGVGVDWPFGYDELAPLLRAGRAHPAGVGSSPIGAAVGRTLPPRRAAVVGQGRRPRRRLRQGRLPGGDDPAKEFR